MQLLPHFETISKSGQEGDNELFETKAFNPIDLTLSEFV